MRDVHHIHVWQINEHDVSLECHIKAGNVEILEEIEELLKHEFEIGHSTIQIENVCYHDKCEL